ncbi:hypothetical protein FGG08_006741 [Glutinoglossum americanum]|uniref:Uncharacterized protein n=1 Tax=Glutinoglossum americanum TaxID=1670608 RepID=A0A9P8I6R7_9PEZI|nr:hypothetical protein FGG08_006741 [Glutinoglossum americanum]
MPVQTANSGNGPILSALGTVIGYIGSEAAPEHLFQRLLWPQRFYNEITTFHDVIEVAFLMPMGGPLYKASLKTLDRFFVNGLFRGSELGHMLGTAFFHDSKLEYTLHINGTQSREHVRNGLLVEAVSLMEIPSENPTSTNIEACSKPAKIRSRIAVSTLRITNDSGHKRLLSHQIGNETGAVTLRIYAALLLSEFAGLVTGVVVLCIWRSSFASLWFIPATLKLLNAFFTIPRQHMITVPASDTVNESESKFEIYLPQHGFLVVEGNTSLILQFFRHYGHPVRGRFREVVQIITVVGFGLVFPVGLFCSVVLMPTELQYVWLCYQLYCCASLYIYRYYGGQSWTSTAKAVARGWTRPIANMGENTVLLSGEGDTRLMASLTSTYCDSYAHGKEVLAKLLGQEMVPDGKRDLEPGPNSAVVRRSTFPLAQKDPSLIAGSNTLSSDAPVSSQTECEPSRLKD